MFGLTGLGQPAIGDALADGLARGLGLSPQAAEVMGHAQSLARGDVFGAIDGLIGDLDAFEGLSIDKGAITGLVGAAISGSPIGIASFAADALGINAKDVASSLGLDGVARGIESISDAVDGLGDAVGKGLGEIGESIGEGISAVGEAIGEGLSDLGEALGLGDDDAATADATDTDTDAADTDASDAASGANDADGADADSADSDSGDSGGGDGGGGDK